MTQSWNEASEVHQQGDGVDLPVTKARSAERTGLIRVLSISLAGAVIAMAGAVVWLMHHAGTVAPPA